MSKTANSSDELTILYEKKVLLPGAGVKNTEEFPRPVLALCDDFRGHSSQATKAFNAGHRQRRKMLKWVIIKGGLTPVAQPLDKLVNKVFKGYLRELYDIYAITAPINPTTGAPYPPSRQLIASWIVEAWERVPEELCAKVWIACGYKTRKELEGDNETALVPWGKDKVGELATKLCGDDIFANSVDEADVGADPMFPEDEGKGEE